MGKVVTKQNYNNIRKYKWRYVGLQLVLIPTTQRMWKAAKRIQRPEIQNPPLKMASGHWARHSKLFLLSH